jgi:hypothetical protein
MGGVLPCLFLKFMTKTPLPLPPWSLFGKWPIVCRPFSVKHGHLDDDSLAPSQWHGKKKKIYACFAYATSLILLNNSLVSFSTRIEKLPLEITETSLSTFDSAHNKRVAFIIPEMQIMQP